MRLDAALYSRCRGRTARRRPPAASSAHRRARRGTGTMKPQDVRRGASRVPAGHPADACRSQSARRPRIGQHGDAQAQRTLAAPRRALGHDRQADSHPRHPAHGIEAAEPHAQLEPTAGRGGMRAEMRLQRAASAETDQIMLDHVHQCQVSTGSQCGMIAAADHHQPIERERMASRARPGRPCPRRYRHRRGRRRRLPRSHGSAAPRARRRSPGWRPGSPPTARGEIRPQRRCSPSRRTCPRSPRA